MTNKANLKSYFFTIHFANIFYHFLNYTGQKSYCSLEIKQKFYMKLLKDSPTRLLKSHSRRRSRVWSGSGYLNLFTSISTSHCENSLIELAMRNKIMRSVRIMKRTYTSTFRFCYYYFPIRTHRNQSDSVIDLLQLQFPLKFKLSILHKNTMGKIETT